MKIRRNPQPWILPLIQIFIFSRRGSSGSTGSSNPGEGTPIKPLVATPKEQPATPNPQKSTKKQVVYLKLEK